MTQKIQDYSNRLKEGNGINTNIHVADNHKYGSSNGYHQNSKKGKFRKGQGQGSMIRSLAPAFITICIILLFYIQHVSFLGLFKASIRQQIETQTISINQQVQMNIYQKQVVNQVTKIQIVQNQSQQENMSQYSKLTKDLDFAIVDNEREVVDSNQIPRVALMFVCKGVIHNEPVWRAFLEAAGRLKLRNQPPKAYNSDLDQLYGPLNKPLDLLREEQYPGWRILHGVIDPMMYKVLGLKRDIPASMLANLIIDPIRYGFDLTPVQDQARDEILRLLSLFPGKMQKESPEQDTHQGDISSLYDIPSINLHPNVDLNALTQQMADKLLHRSDILDSPSKFEVARKNVEFAISRLLRRDSGKALTGREVYESQDLFSIYVHPLVGYVFPPGSIFEGREVSPRVNTTKAFAQHDMVEAEVALLRFALQDPRNHKFVLVSENCIPLHPPEILWAQLLSEQYSRINGCKQEKYTSNIYRWKKQMKTDVLHRQHWRKSSQWFVLNRPHGELVVRDKHVLEMFKRYCWSWYDPVYKKDHVCVSDEHAIPTLLASYGLDDETDCLGGGTFTDWQRGGWHPHTWQAEEITPQQLNASRTGLKTHSNCDVKAAAKGARRLFDLIPNRINTETLAEETTRQLLNLASERTGVDGDNTNNLSQQGVKQSITTNQEDQNYANQIKRAEMVMKELMGHQTTIPEQKNFVQAQSVVSQEPVSARPPASMEQLLQRRNAATSIPIWFEQHGYQSMPKECPLFMRKFPPQATLETLHATLTCEGVGLGYWCYDQWYGQNS
eukprot:TRINITY_DN5712_c0_g2_i1.p1 TRINITY_DN5712_c0_g2~~TRINITY_DN5712_c0_g2_i1.p1  ORF type:complete len:783 (+),score=57.11 TRINITY_DN5712_c0_g2_i1:271-2619(+)